jgi:hypothetical protein
LGRKPSAAKKHAQIETISIAGITAPMGPAGLIFYSKSFLSAAKSITVSSEMDFMPARTYLVCHALELSLKAFLSLKGHSLAALADPAFGHDLGALLAEAEKHGLSDIAKLTASHQFQIQRASKYYLEKVFEYPAIGEMVTTNYGDRPSTDVLISGAEVLVAALYDPCFSAT